MVQAVKDVVQHEPHFILEIVDNGFGSLAMRARVNLRSMRVLDPKRLIKGNEGSNGELGGVFKVKALGDNGKVCGSRVRVVWMVVDGGNVRARLVSKEVAKVVLLLRDSEALVKALGDNGKVCGSRVRVVWMVVDGGNVRARLVSKEVAKVVLLLLRDSEALVLWFWMGELSLEEMSMKSVRGICFGGFWVKDLALDAMEYDDQDRWNEEDGLQVLVCEDDEQRSLNLYYKAMQIIKYLNH
nr:hypothetical protein [Tanacetum cinerariifolium]